MALVRLGLLVFSAAVAALIVALIMPLTEPESLAAIARHPLGGRVLNASSAAAQAIADLLAGISPADSGPNLHRYYPLPLNASSAGAAQSPRASGSGRHRVRPGPELDWADPEVWRLQAEQVTAPYYTTEEIDRLLYWCEQPVGSANAGDVRGRGSSDGTVGSSGTGGGTTSGEVNGGGGVEGGDSLAARYSRLAGWVAANGGDVAAVTLGTDAEGVRGLHATRDIQEGEVVLSVPLRLGLSVTTFRAARLAAAATGHWRAAEDGDMFLDPLALSYEVAVHGERSPWADHLCLLPRAYGGLPVHASDPRDVALLAQLPALRRLAAKRRAQLALFGNDLARPTLETLPGGRAALARLSAAGQGTLSRGAGGGASGKAGVHAGSSPPDTSRGAKTGGSTTGTPTSTNTSSSGAASRDRWLPLWHWAYAAAKTRGVTLAAEEAREIAAEGGGPGDGALPAVLRLPVAMLEWVQDVGALLPVFDLANHAFAGHGANVGYQILGESSGSGLAACLVAQQPIRAGQPLLFDYTEEMEAEQGPACSDRWLLEYGFVPQSNDPRRDCDTMEVTAPILARALQRVCPAATASAVGGDADRAGAEDDCKERPNQQCSAKDVQAHLALVSRLAARLAQLPAEGLPQRLEVQVRHWEPSEYDDDVGTEEGRDLGSQHMQARPEALQWLRAALREEWAACGAGTTGGAAAAGRAGSAQHEMAARVLAALLEDREAELRSLAEQAAALATEEGGGDGSSQARELRAGIATVAAGARRAVQRALVHERSGGV